MKKILALVLCAALLLSGCGAKNALGLSAVVKFEDMVYARPNMEDVEAAFQTAVESGESAKDADEVLEAVWDFYDQYESFSTAYDLAYIHYHTWLQDILWQEEYEFCAENAPTLDRYLEELYHALAQSPHRDALEEEYFGEGWFEDFEGESILDEELVALLEQEQQLIAHYHDTFADARGEDYAFEGMPLAQILAQLVNLRRDIARTAGYDCYTDFAWDYYYYRDYTPTEARAYLEQIKELAPLYGQLYNDDRYTAADYSAGEEEVFGYVKSAAKEMGGVVWEAFRLLEQGELYNIGYSKDKSGLSFELYFSQYAEPYILVCGEGSRYDCLTFAHEFGHFAADYAAAGSLAGIDVMEVFSQAMELMSLCYAGDGETLTQVKLEDAFCTYIEQAALAAFELAMYDLPAEQVTGEQLLDLYEAVCMEYGLDAGVYWEPWELVSTIHFYSNPLYVISYVVSGDAALQLYRLETQTPGAGRDIFLDTLDTEQSYFLAFLEEAGLESPFDRVDDVKALMESYLSVS